MRSRAASVRCITLGSPLITSKTKKSGGGNAMAKSNNYAGAIELAPGVNIYVNTEPEESKPPDNFVDPNTYCFCTVDGKIRLRGIILGPRSIDFPFKPEKLFCAQQRGEDTMVIDNSYDWPAIIAEGLKIIEEGRSQWATAVALKEKYDINVTIQAIQGRLKSAMKKQGLLPGRKEGIAPEPESEAALPQTGPAQEPVLEAARDDEITVVDVLLAELQQREVAGDSVTGPEPIREQSPEKLSPVSQHDPSDNDFAAEDDIPIPYGLPPAPVLYDIDGFKIELIQAAIQKGECWDLPNKVILELIGQLKDLEVGA